MSIIQIKMKDQTLNQVDKLRDRVQAPSRSDAIRRAVEISDVLMNAVEQGEKIIIESKDGRKKQIIINGLNRAS